jgi:hypothetical protein
MHACSRTLEEEGIGFTTLRCSPVPSMREAMVMAVILESLQAINKRNRRRNSLSWRKTFLVQVTRLKPATGGSKGRMKV